MLFFSSFVLLKLASLVSAWLPGQQKDIYTIQGTNLFNTTLHRNLTTRWLPGSGKIRGVNLGSLFVVEPWMTTPEWNNMGCGGQNSEFDCVSTLGQSKANSVFQQHWGSWITQGDIQQMQSYGLNTIRIPVGYWMMESIVYTSEHFPQGGAAYLERICGWASDAGFYIIIDMHGAPGAQDPQQPFTGQFAPTAGFYVDYQYTRAEQFLGWLTNLIHTKNSFRNVGMIGVVNEPLRGSDAQDSMRSQFYPAAYNAIRSAESSLGVTSNNYVHVQLMNQLWGSGDPNQYMSNRNFLAYDDHRYVKYDSSVQVSHNAYLSASCHDNRGSDGLSPTIVGEWSLSVPDNVESSADWAPNSNLDFYTKWFAAQVMSYETYTMGWIFWSWKAQLGDYRWSYKDAVQAGVIPGNVANVNSAVCNGY